MDEVAQQRDYTRWHRHEMTADQLNAYEQLKRQRRQAREWHVTKGRLAQEIIERFYLREITEWLARQLNKPSRQ